MSVPIQLSVYTTDGKNTGTVRLVGTAQLRATIQGLATPVTWAVQGAGSISADGLYQAPSSMPATSIVTVTATSASSSSVSAAYQFSLVNPIPAIYNAYTAQGVLLPGTTNSTTISGGNFTPDSTVLVNGNPVATAYQSVTILIAQIPVPMSTQGSVPITVQNPAPAGGMSAVYLKQIAPNAIQLSMYTSDGKNTGTVRLVGTAQLRATIQGLATPVTWAVQGAGSISATASIKLHPACRQLPLVTVTATSASSSSVSAAYQFSLVNPIPAIYNAYTAQGVLLPGTTNSTTISGGNFTPDSTVLVNGNPVATAYQSATILIAQIPVPINTQGSVPITVQNPAPAGGISAVYLNKLHPTQSSFPCTHQTGRTPVRFVWSVRPNSGRPSKALATPVTGPCKEPGVSPATAFIKLHPACRQLPLSL